MREEWGGCTVPSESLGSSLVVDALLVVAHTMIPGERPVTAGN